MYGIEGTFTRNDFLKRCGKRADDGFQKGGKTWGINGAGGGLTFIQKTRKTGSQIDPGTTKSFSAGRRC